MGLPAAQSNGGWSVKAIVTRSVVAGRLRVWNAISVSRLECPLAGSNDSQVRRGPRAMRIKRKTPA